MIQSRKSIIVMVVLVAVLGHSVSACAFSREQASVMLAKIRMYYPDLLQQQGYMNNQYGNQGLTNPTNQYGQTYPNQNQFPNQNTFPNQQIPNQQIPNTG